MFGTTQLPTPSKAKYSAFTFNNRTQVNKHMPAQALQWDHCLSQVLAMRTGSGTSTGCARISSFIYLGQHPCTVPGLQFI